MIESKFAPTPTHGAAYAVVIEKVGGAIAIGDCSTQTRYSELRSQLDRIMEWANGQSVLVKNAYRYGVTRVDADLRSRLEVHENSRRVLAARADLPKPEGL